MGDGVKAPPPEAVEPLGPEDTARLTDFARACKAAARAVVLYPPAHPAIAATLGRIAALTDPTVLPSPLTLGVLPDGLLLDGRKPSRPDPAIGRSSPRTAWLKPSCSSSRRTVPMNSRSTSSSSTS